MALKPVTRGKRRPSYNRIVKGPAIAVAALGLSIALLSGCKKDIKNDDAVRQGIMNYLSKRPDLLAMDVNVASVDYRQDEATATVRFQAKGNTSPGAGMTMQYVLERKGNEWMVKGRAGANAHGENGLRKAAVPAPVLSAQCQIPPYRPDILPWARPRCAIRRFAAGTSAHQFRQEAWTIQMKRVAVLGGGPAGAFAAERLARAGLETRVFDEKLAWEKPCGGGLTYKAYSRYPFLIENERPKKIINETCLAAPTAGAVQMD